jgi:hypothetical protein
MAHDPRRLVAVLEAELEFLETGRYVGPSQPAWKAPSLFLDSPSCLNFKQPHRPYPCSECFLIDFVPPSSLEESVPCHFIPLNEQGETVNSLERQAHQSEMEDALKKWLRATIARLRAMQPPAEVAKKSAQPSQT